jgi:hypothetical protein
MPLPAAHVQLRTNRQYNTTLQQCFSVLTPVVNMQADPNDPPRPAQFDNSRASTLLSLLAVASQMAHNASKWSPELTGMGNHASRAHLRLQSLIRLIRESDTSRLGYPLATVAHGLIEALPRDLFIDPDAVSETTAQ